MRQLLLGVALSALAAPSWAQINSDIVTIGTRIGSADIDTLTSPVSVITEDDIRARGQRYVSDLLRTLPGLAVSVSGARGGLTQIRMRGSEANHVLVLIDGVEVNNPNAGEFDFSGLRAEDLVRVEVLRGEQSALYGSDAVGGVISLTTRAGATDAQRGLQVEYGTQDTASGQASFVVPLGGASLSLNGTLFSTEGFDISGTGGENDGSESRAVNIGLNQLEIGRLTVSAKYGNSRLETDFDGDTDFDGRLNDTDGLSIIKTETARLDGTFDLAGFAHRITLSRVQTDTDTMGGFSSRSVGTRKNANWTAKTTRGAHSLTVLAEAEDETYRITPNFTEAGAEPKNETYALAGDYQYLSGPITVTASLRQDFNDLFQDATTWRVGAGYAFEGWSGRLRGSYGVGVKNPTLIELFGFFPASRFTGNPDLQPESARGLNIGYTQDIAGIRLSIDYFRSELEDEITTIFNPDFTSTAVNLTTDSTREGVEIEADWHVSDTVSLRGAMTFLDSKENDTPEIRRPDFTASAAAEWQASDTLSLTVTLDHTGSQTDLDFGGFPAATVDLDGYTLLGLNSVYHVNDTISLTLRGENLLDEDYQDIFGYASQGRTIFAGLRANF